MLTYYNEFCPHSAQWLRNLIDEGLISSGFVDDRSILDINSTNLNGYSRCHFFAGIGCWDEALRQAGWPTSLPVWTGSCPCQPFSVAGKGKGLKDERHLWPIWYELIKEQRPPIIFGEQSSSKAALEWFNLVQNDLEKEGYAVGGADLCAASVGAPHVRQRLYFVAYSSGFRWPQHGNNRAMAGEKQEPGKDCNFRSCYSSSAVSTVADTHFQRFSGEPILLCQRGPHQESLEATRGCNFVAECETGCMGCPMQQRLEGREPLQCRRKVSFEPPSLANYWSDCDWLYGRDGKFRPVEPGTFPLVDGDSFKLGSGSPQEGKNRSEMIKAYGNAICIPLAAQFIKVCMEFLKV